MGRQINGSEVSQSHVEDKPGVRSTDTSDVQSSSQASQANDRATNGNRAKKAKPGDGIVWLAMTVLAGLLTLGWGIATMFKIGPPTTNSLTTWTPYVLGQLIILSVLYLAISWFSRNYRRDVVKRSAEPHEKDTVPQEPSDYDLKIDSQVEKFLEMKHKVVFFLLTAAIGSIGFTLNFAIARLAEVAGHPWRIGSLIVASVTALVAAGLVLYSLNQEIVSYQLHLKSRYGRKSWDQLTKAERTRWEEVNKRAKDSQRAAFLGLFISVGLQVSFFVMFLA